MQEKTFFIKTFGCQMNIRDTEIMAQTLSEGGYIESDSINDASLVILNTCSIRAKAEQKVFSLLGSLRKNKALNPDLQICVAGCVAQQEGRKIIKRMPHVDLIIGTQHIYNLPQLLSHSSINRTAINLADDYEIPRFVPTLTKLQQKRDHGSPPLESEFQFSRFVTIMQGCNNFCTYCVVPYTRGREVSRNVADILDEIKVLVSSGVSEVTLLGQNVNSYGKSNSVTENQTPYSFAMLLHDVAQIDGLRRLRFTTSNPKDLSDELIDCFAEIDILCPQFHLPVQSGSDSILKRMNRKYSIKEYLQKVDGLRKVCPQVAITTDIIVGFPGETEEDFEGTMNLLETVQYNGSFSFKYSDRPGTKAQLLDSKVPEPVKSDRLQRFQKRQDEISLEKNRSYVGDTLMILVEKVAGEKMVGRTDTNHIVHIELTEKNDINPGDYLEVAISFAGQHSLKADLAW
jgi:tRNA-2-methylthio-N6-dimethylallyladenosine synthase